MERPSPEYFAEDRVHSTAPTRGLQRSKLVTVPVMAMEASLTLDQALLEVS